MYTASDHHCRQCMSARCSMVHNDPQRPCRACSRDDDPTQHDSKYVRPEDCPGYSGLAIGVCERCGTEHDAPRSYVTDHRSDPFSVCENGPRPVRGSRCGYCRSLPPRGGWVERARSRSLPPSAHGAWAYAR